jgi:hypothetical protein
MKTGGKKMSTFIQALVVAGMMTVGMMLVPFYVFAADAPVAAAEGSPAPAPEPVSPHTFSTTANFLSDYVWRGLSNLTWGQPAVQTSFDYAHASGIYAGIWGSNISANVYPNVQLELDYYTGYNGKITDNWGYTAGVYYVTYPGASYDKFNPVFGTTLPDKKFDWWDVNAGISYKWISVKLWYSLTNFLGYSDKTTPIGSFAGDPAAGVRSGDTVGSTYIEANANFDLGWDSALGLHAGKMIVKNGTKLDWEDYKAGVTKQLGKGWNVALAYTAATNANEYSGYPSAAGQGTTKNLNENKAVFSVGRSF